MQVTQYDIVKSNKLCFVAKDLRSKYIYCNDIYKTFLNVEERDIIGKTDFDIFGYRAAQLYQSGDSRVLRGGIFLNQVEELSFEGRTVKIAVTKNQLRNKNNEIIGVAISFLEVADHVVGIQEELLKFNKEKKCYYFKIGQQQEYFTEREYKIFKFILFNFTAKHIAHELNLSPRTVEDYIGRIRIKLQCSSKFHIVETALRLGLIHQNII